MIRRLLLWDIDGTLLRAGGLGGWSFQEAMVDVVGRRAEHLPVMAGKTDPQIVREGLAAAGVEVTDQTVGAVLDALAARLASAADRLAEQARPCPGVPDVLARVAADPRLHSGLLTGNIAPNARLKVTAAGLAPWVDFETAAYGSDSVDRNALVPIAVQRTAQHLGVHLQPADVWVIGDTPRDLECARAEGARCLLVATGSYSSAELGTLGADDVLEDLADADAVVKLLCADL